jgi:hypothetical protein
MFQMFHCLKTYVVIIASECFKTRSGVASSSSSSAASPRCQVGKREQAEVVPTGTGGPHVHAQARDNMQHMQQQQVGTCTIEGVG